MAQNRAELPNPPACTETISVPSPSSLLAAGLGQLATQTVAAIVRTSLSLSIYIYIYTYLCSHTYTDNVYIYIDIDIHHIEKRCKPTSGSTIGIPTSRGSRFWVVEVDNSSPPLNGQGQTIYEKTHIHHTHTHTFTYVYIYTYKYVCRMYDIYIYTHTQHTHTYIYVYSWYRWYDWPNDSHN